MPVEAPVWNAVSACSRRPRTTRAWASVCLLGITAQKRMRARSVAIAAWLLSEPYGGARDPMGLLVPLRPACLLTGQAGFSLPGVTGRSSSGALRAGVNDWLTSAGLDSSLSKECHARCHVAAASPRAFPPRLQGRSKAWLFLFRATLTQKGP